MSRVRFVPILAWVVVAGCASAEKDPVEHIPQNVTYPAFDLSAVGTPSPVSDDFLFAEGPIWAPDEEALYFADINADVIYRMTLPHTFEKYLEPAGIPDGLALDPRGRIIGAGFASRDVFRVEDGKRVSIVSSFEGKKLNSPDDLIARSDGVIYFTDPLFGIDGNQGLTKQTEELGFQGVFRITVDGAIHVEDQAPTGGPNGVELSPDEKTLYVSYTGTGEIYSFSVAPDGALTNKTLFATAGLPDSMCVDAAGNVYVAASNGIAVFDSTGADLGVIAVPGIPTNPTFGGINQDTLYISTRFALIGTPTPGNSVLLRIDGMPIPGIPGRP